MKYDMTYDAYPEIPGPCGDVVPYGPFEEDCVDCDMREDCYDHVTCDYCGKSFYDLPTPMDCCELEDGSCCCEKCYSKGVTHDNCC